MTAEKDIASGKRKPDECESCNYETDALRWYEVMDLTRQGFGHWYCGLYAGTLTSHSVEYPRANEGQAEMMRTICYVGNAIIAAVNRAARGGA